MTSKLFGLVQYAAVGVLVASGLCSGQEVTGRAATFNEPFRPQFHFSPEKNWTNDPNGPVFFDGEYHLFFQYNPLGDKWGHMSWGHAISTDLLHWKEFPVALAEENGVMIFTGSTVVDRANNSGFCQGGKPCLVAIYTGHTPRTKSGKSLQTQNLAFSNDRGRTWTRYKNNPVLNLNTPDFRDPDVFWSDSGKRWVMAVSLPDDHKIRFYGSPNLKEWKQLSDFGPAGAVSGQWECPNLIELPVDGNVAHRKWVLKVGLNPGALQGGSGEQYFVGHFDGTRFISENATTLTLWSDYGKDCYCALAFNGLPRTETPVMIGWMSNWQYADKLPTSPWRGQMTAPREVALRTFPEGIRLVQKPAKPMKTLRDRHFTWAKGPVDAVNTAISRAPVRSHSFQLNATLQSGMANELGLKLFGKGEEYTLVGFNKGRKELFVDRTHSGLVGFSKDFPARVAAPITDVQGPLHIEILADRNSLEVFAEGGRVVLTNLVFPHADAYTIAFYSDNRAATVEAEAWTLRSVWPDSGKQ